MLLDAAYLLAVDTLARSIATVETPLGIVTATGRRALLPLAARARPQRLVLMRLEAVDLAIGYPGRWLVGWAINLAIGLGEVLCLLGPNGSGKTTLFRTLLGLVPAQDGSFSLNGQPLAALTRADIVRRMAYVQRAQSSPFA